MDKTLEQKVIELEKKVTELEKQLTVQSLRKVIFDYELERNTEYCEAMGFPLKTT